MSQKVLKFIVCSANCLSMQLLFFGLHSTTSRQTQQSTSDRTAGPFIYNFSCVKSLDDAVLLAANWVLNHHDDGDGLKDSSNMTIAADLTFFRI